MLTVAEVPEEINDLYEKSKIPVGMIIGRVSDSFTSTPLQDKTDLCVAFPASVIYIRSGIFKYFFKGKFIRFYSTGDIVTTPVQMAESVSIVNEFGADIVVVPENRFLEKLAGDEELLQKWFTNRLLENHIMHALCALFVGEEFSPQFEIRQYKEGDVIIEEGDSPDNLFEMIEGKASVCVRGTEIGTVKEGEIFGEISFLTGKPRSATVKATAQSLVQVIRGEDFEKFSRCRPASIYRLSKTLARRLTEVNERLVSISSMT